MSDWAARLDEAILGKVTSALNVAKSENGKLPAIKAEAETSRRVKSEDVRRGEAAKVLGLDAHL